MIQPDFPQDPDELFDVVNESGEPTGIVKRRADVHRDGDWHRAIHVWVYGLGPDDPHVLYNLRSRHKDTMPLKIDVTVGGHLGAGESPADAFREIEEEIGIAAAPENLEYLFRRKAYGDTERELQEVFLLRDDRSLAEFRPNPAELEALVQISLDEAQSLFSESCASVEATALIAASGTIESLTVDEQFLLPQRYFPYYLDVARAISTRLEGSFTPGV